MSQRQSGLGLLECMVALAILAISITAAYRSIAVASSQHEALRDRLLAEWVAHDRLAEYRVRNVWIDASSLEGEAEQGGKTFHYREEIKAVEFAPANFFRLVEVKVYLPGSDHALSTMTGFIAQ